jgi:hypothetical protein
VAIPPQGHQTADQKRDDGSRAKIPGGHQPQPSGQKNEQGIGCVREEQPVPPSEWEVRDDVENEVGSGYPQHVVKSRDDFHLGPLITLVGRSSRASV